jgi:CelD/BcsL family acetyltransferase involved in cellulose biosynthesis
MPACVAVRAVVSLGEMVQLRSRWDELLADASADTVFLTWEWLYSWAEQYVSGERRLYVLLVEWGRDLIGIAPWCVKSVRKAGIPTSQIEFLGSPEAASDYLDVIARRGCEQAVAEAIFEFLHLSSAPRWHTLFLRDIPANSLFLGSLLETASAARLHLEVRTGAYSPIVRLPSSVDTFRAGLSANRRQRHARMWRQISKLEMARHASTAPGERVDMAHLAACYAHYRRRWPNTPAEHWSFLTAALRRLDEKAWNQLDVLLVDQAVVAGLLHFRYRGALSMYLMAVDREYSPRLSLGHALVGRAIEAAIQAGFETYDFLRGTEDYKASWANDGRRALRVTVYRRGIVAAGAVIGRALRSLTRIVRSGQEARCGADS